MSIIKKFEKVRDIPYRIPLTPEEPDECCTGKAELLLKIFKQSGYDVRYRLCTFRWSGMSLPKELENMPHDDDSSHTYLEVKIDGQWKIIDATWDKGLEDLFVINEWDGKSDTEIAVQCIKCLSLEESSKHIKRISTLDAIISDLIINRKFYKAFNEWLETNRR